MAIPSIFLYNLSLKVKKPSVARCINLINISFLIGGRVDRGKKPTLSKKACQTSRLRYIQSFFILTCVVSTTQRNTKESKVKK